MDDPDRPDAGGLRHQRICAVCLWPDIARDEGTAWLDLCPGWMAEHGECDGVCDRVDGDAGFNPARVVGTLVQRGDGRHLGFSAGNRVDRSVCGPNHMANSNRHFRGDGFYHRRGAFSDVVCGSSTTKRAGNCVLFWHWRRFRHGSKRRCFAGDV